MTGDTDGGIRMQRYAPRDLPGVYRVCAEVDARGGKQPQRLQVPELAGHVFAGPYLVSDPALGWVVADRLGVAGYIVGTADAVAFEQWRERQWYPALRKRHPMPADGEAHGDDARYLRFLHSAPPQQSAPAERSAYPAELHIKLAPRAAGLGWGRPLVEALIDELRARDVPGLHLHVAEENSSAIAFYERLAFRTLHRNDASRTMIREIA